MASGRFLIVSGCVLLLVQCQFASTQHISIHANPEIGQTLVRPHTATPAPNSTNTVKYLPRTTTTITPPLSTTPKSPGFLNSLRNIFSPGSRSTTTTTAKPATNFHVQNGARNAATRTTTTRKPTDEFPPLTFHSNNRGSTSYVPAVVPSSTQPSAWSTTRSTTPSSTASAWSTIRSTTVAPTRAASPTASATGRVVVTTTRPATRQPPNPRPLSSAGSSSSLISLDSRDRISSGGSTQRPELATDAETEEISEILYRKSSPNLYPFVTVNLQKRTKSSVSIDEAPLPLLTINETILNEVPTIAKMRALFNNYEVDSTVNEYVSPVERQEENEFLDEVLKTPVMKAAMKFLQDKGVVTADPKTHFELLKTIWFNLYSRGQGKIGSSAFEHVFMNEIKNNSVTGLHNWIWFYHRESEKGVQHDINYKGYMKNIELGNQKAQLIKYRFSMNNIEKPVNSMFIGTLPELDMALYTVCFEVNKSECRVSLDGNKFVIRTYPFKYRGKRLIGSAFPEL